MVFLIIISHQLLVPLNFVCLKLLLACEYSHLSSLMGDGKKKRTLLLCLVYSVNLPDYFISFYVKFLMFYVKLEGGQEGGQKGGQQVGQVLPTPRHVKEQTTTKEPKQKVILVHFRDLFLFFRGLHALRGLISMPTIQKSFTIFVCCKVEVPEQTGKGNGEVTILLLVQQATL